MSFQKTALVACLMLVPAFAHASDRTVAAKSGERTAYSHIGSWDDNCRPNKVSIKLIRKPKNGSLDFKSIKGRIGHGPNGAILVDGTFSKCHNKRIPMIEVSYTPDSDHKGKDSATYELTDPYGTHRAKIDFVIE